jgi:phosphosulfolactate phosphohydrolase-like enzyme
MIAVVLGPVPVDARPEHRQRRHEIRLEWGPEGAALLAAECAVVIVVDVLSFSTAVDVAVGRGAAILPQRRVGSADRAAEEAEQAVAQFAAARDGGLADVLAACASGQELIADGYGADITLAAALDASTVAPPGRDGLLQAG